MEQEKKQFPVFKTRIEGEDRKFDLADPEQRRKYFELKAGPEIKKLKEYLKDRSFIAYLLGKKNAGKGTYSKLFMEVIGGERVAHISVGDVVRGVHKDMEDPDKKKELVNFLKQNYRGYISAEEALNALLNRDTKTLLPTEFTLALIKREISKMGKKALFIDGFPRDLDQVSYSLFFRDLIDYRADPDIFVLIDVPNSVIDERIKYRVVCPNCQTPRNLKLLATKQVEYDDKEKKFYLLCDNPECRGTRMISKEGDELGIAPIKARLEKDGELIQKAFSLHGIPKVLLRNSVPVDLADKYVDDYELTPEYSYEYDSESGKVKTIEKPWTILDDQGVSSYSLMPAAVVVSMIKQMAKIFCS